MKVEKKIKLQLNKYKIINYIIQNNPVYVHISNNYYGVEN